ncbi:MAG: hypothetical protein EXR76_10975 [Myxococcales bacterium]|nr:hypothetical protein [Myxococcales bacterium]
MHPFYGPRFGAWLNDEVLGRSVRARAAELGFDRRTVLSTVPNMAGLVGHLDERAAIYYCVDDFSTWPGYSAEVVGRMERRLVQTCDRLVVTAQALREKWARPKLPVLDLPHGVDVSHFAATASMQRRDDGLPGPHLLCLGLWDERLDVALLRAVLDARPTWHLHIVGQRTAGAGPLGGHAQVRILSAVPYHDLPTAI